MNVRDIMELRALAPADMGLNNDFLVERSADDGGDPGEPQNPVDWIYHLLFGLLIGISIFL